MLACARAPGTVAGLFCVQVVPSYRQVSLSGTLVALSPPRRTVWLRAESYTIVDPLRGGGLVAGLCWVQFCARSAVGKKRHVKSEALAIRKASPARPKPWLLNAADLICIYGPES